jgi:hypothetical protein
VAGADGFEGFAGDVDCDVRVVEQGRDIEEGGVAISYEVVVDEPVEVARFTEMPVNKRIERGIIDRELVDAPRPARNMLAAAIDTQEAILLPNKMKHGEVGEDAPEEKAVLPI